MGSRSPVRPAVSKAWRSRRGKTGPSRILPRCFFLWILFSLKFKLAICPVLIHLGLTSTSLCYIFLFSGCWNMIIITNSQWSGFTGVVNFSVSSNCCNRNSSVVALDQVSYFRREHFNNSSLATSSPTSPPATSTLAASTAAPRPTARPPGRTWSTKSAMSRRKRFARACAGPQKFRKNR